MTDFAPTSQAQADRFRTFAARIEREFAGDVPGKFANPQGAVDFFASLTAEQIDAILEYLPADGQLAAIARSLR